MFLIRLPCMSRCSSEYGPGRAICIYPDDSWKDLGTVTSVPVAPGEDTTPPEKVTGLAVPAVDGKYKATFPRGTGVDNSGKMANCEIQLDNEKILKSSKTSTVRDMTAPEKASVKAEAEENSLFLSWKTPKDNVGVTGYILKRGIDLEHSEFLAAD